MKGKKKKERWDKEWKGLVILNDTLTTLLYFGGWWHLQESSLKVKIGLTYPGYEL